MKRKRSKKSKQPAGDNAKSRNKKKRDDLLSREPITPAIDRHQDDQQPCGSGFQQRQQQQEEEEEQQQQQQQKKVNLAYSIQNYLEGGS